MSCFPKEFHNLRKNWLISMKRRETFFEQRNFERKQDQHIHHRRIIFLPKLLMTLEVAETLGLDG